MRQRAGSPGDQAGARAGTSEAAAGKVSRSERIYRRAAGPGETMVDPAAALARTEGQTGAALPATAQDRFERSLGADLSSVRVHTGPASAQAASELGARAFTTRQDIHFGRRAVPARRPLRPPPAGARGRAHRAAAGRRRRPAGQARGHRAAGRVRAGRRSCRRRDGHRRPGHGRTGGAAGGATGGGGAPSPAAPEAPTAATAPTSFVPFTAQGTWSGADVVAALRGLATVPPGLEAAIVAGCARPRSTASTFAARSAWPPAIRRGRRHARRSPGP
ncbi:MAG: DUF4157 domain-containing protein [Kofleriaceae bacterium]|nr:DUF4157 domain-containing protein [Kofleriaceae bacterium]